MNDGRYAWMDSALCAQADPDAWTDTRVGSPQTAPKRICDRCPVQAACTAHADALEADGESMAGVWGGRSSKQRRQARQGRSGCPKGR